MGNQGWGWNAHRPVRVCQGEQQASICACKKCMRGEANCQYEKIGLVYGSSRTRLIHDNFGMLEIESSAGARGPKQRWRQFARS